MTHLQYQNQNIINGRYNFDKFTAKKKEYYFPSVLEALAYLVPELKTDIAKFNHNFLNLTKDAGSANIPVGTNAEEGELEITRFTKDKESFLQFKDKIQSLNTELKSLQEKIRKYEDTTQLTQSYLGGLKYVVRTQRVGWGSPEKHTVNTVNENKESVVLELSSEQIKMLNPREYYLSILTEAKLGLTSRADLVELVKSKNPFAKLIKTPLYSCTESDLNFEAEKDLVLPMVEMYYLVQEFPNLVPSLRWAHVKGIGGNTQVEMMPDIKDATPLNSARMMEIMRYGRDYTCVRFMANVTGVLFKKNQLGEKIEAVLEKEKLTTGLDELVMPARKKANKI